MIFSSLRGNDDFSTYPEAIRKALNFLKNTDFDSIAAGDHPIDGDKMFAKIFDFTTLPLEAIRPEVHIKYIDVQYWPDGSERFGISFYSEKSRIVEAKEASDVYFLESVPDESFITALPGCFAVFFPWDAHRPGVMLDEPLTFRKCVIKVSVDLL